MSDRDTAQGTAGEPTPAEPAAAIEAEVETAVEANRGEGVRPATPYLTWGLVVAVVFFAGLAAWPLLAPRLPPSWRGDSPAEARLAERLAPLAARVAALEERLAAPAGAQAIDLEPLRGAVAAEEQARRDAVAALGTRLDTLQRQLAELPARAPAPQPATERLAARLSTLERQVADVEGAGETATKLEDEIAVLGERLAAIENRIAGAGAASRRQSLVLAVGQLAAAVAQGQAYRDELERLTGLAGEDTEIGSAVELLAPTAERGVAGLAELRRRFDALAGEIVRAGSAPAPDGWLERAAGRLKQLVTVRRTGEVEGGETDAVVARAEVRLGDGDLAGAVRELGALQGAAAETADAWRRAAEARLVAERAVGRLQARAIELLGQS